MCGLSVYLYSFDYDFDTYVWDKNIHAYRCERTGDIKKCPCTFASNFKYVNFDPDEENDYVTNFNK